MSQELPPSTVEALPPSVIQNGTILVPLIDAEGPAAHAAATDAPNPVDRPPGSMPASTVQSSSGALSPSSSRTLNVTPVVGAGAEPEPDPAILEALRSAKERLYILKLADAMETLIHDRK